MAAPHEMAPAAAWIFTICRCGAGFQPARGAASFLVSCIKGGNEKRRATKLETGGNEGAIYSVIDANERLKGLETKGRFWTGFVSWRDGIQQA
jgi:hypothetical protein